MIKRRILWASCTGLLLSACANQPAKVGYVPQPHKIVKSEGRNIRKKLIKTISRLQHKYGITGLSLTLVKDQEILWSEGFGYADVDNRVLASPDTIYRAGSLVKPFTAMGVMQLEEHDQLDIDQPLFAYLPNFAIRSRFDTVAEPITLRSMMCHHSGLPTDLNKGMWSTESFKKVASQLAGEYTAFPPNLVFSYSNVGFTLLGHVIEEVSRLPYKTYMQSKLFRPLGMTDSGVTLTQDMVKQLSKGYRQGREAALLPIRDLPAFSFYTTSSDLGYFMAGLFNPSDIYQQGILMPETVEDMLEPQNEDVSLDMSVSTGLAWFLEQDTIPGGGRVIRHGGTTLLFSSELIMLPEHKLGIAVLANSSGSRAIVSRLAEEILQHALGTEDTDDENELVFYEHLPDLNIPDVASVGGTYATDLGLISIKPQEAKLCACILDENLDLIPYPNGWFGVRGNGIDSLPPSFKALGSLRFQIRTVDGREVIIADDGHKTNVLGEKIPEEVIPKAWLQRVGEYRLMNPDSMFPMSNPQINAQGGQLSLSYKMPLLSNKIITVPIRAISDTEAVILGLGRSRGDTLRAYTEKGEAMIRYSGYVGQKI